MKAPNKRPAESRQRGSGQEKTRTHVQVRAYGKRPKTAAERKARIAEILALLAKMYPDAVCALHHSNPWELLVATILSAQCTDKRVNEVTPGLFAKYPTPADFAAVRPEVLAQDCLLYTSSLTHPNIARMLDAGHLDNGQPYLAMEYVEGQPIDAFAAGLSIRQKIALFLKVCSCLLYTSRCV